MCVLERVGWGRVECVCWEGKGGKRFYCEA